MSTYMLTAVSAVIAGVVLTAYLGTAKSTAATATMDIITAVVLGGALSTGGKGSIVGTALASFCCAFLRWLATVLQRWPTVSGYSWWCPAGYLSSLLDRHKRNKYRCVLKSLLSGSSKNEHKLWGDWP